MNRIKKILYSQKLAPYIFILPFILVFLIFFLYPICNTVVMSFQTILPGQVTFVQFDNYNKMFHDKNFYKAVTNSLMYTVGTLILLIPIPMLIACLIDSKSMVGRNLFKSVMFVPALTSVVVAGTIFRLIFGEMQGSLMNQVIGMFGMEPIKWLKIQSTGFMTLLLLACWRWTGVNTLYFLSGLKNIPKDVYESAQIDGANAWQMFKKITVPMLRPTTIYVLTISVYGGLAMFLESYMLWNGNNSPKNIGLTIVGYLYRQGWEQNRMGYASAVGLVLLVIAMVINVTQLRITGVLGKERD